MSAAPAFAPAARLRVDYVDEAHGPLLAAPDVLAVFGFGAGFAPGADPRVLHVRLPVHGAAPLEVWRAQGPVAHGREDVVAWSEDAALQFGAIELDEPAGIDRALDDAARRAYARLLAFTAARGYPHLLRVWNYLDGITEGDGDDERYKRFCLGRGDGLGTRVAGPLPAATAIGRPQHDTSRRLQVYWLAARTPGTPLENPRQVSAYRYPRQYGPQPPSFARAMLPDAPMPLLLSGTAAIVGHQSLHADDVTAQVDETLANIASLIDAARRLRPDLPPRLDASSRLKVYVRDAEDLEAVAEALDARLEAAVPRIVLHAAVCRRELRVEIDGTHG